MSLFKKNSGRKGPGDYPELPGSRPLAGVPRHPQSYVKGEELVDHYRRSAAEAQASLGPKLSQLRQEMDETIQQAATQFEAQLKSVMEQLSQEFEKHQSLASTQLAQRQGLQNQWLHAPIEELTELLRLADSAELASCLECAPLTLIARFLILEPKLAQVTPIYPAPLDELALLWQGLSASGMEST